MPTVVINHDLPLANSLEGQRDDLSVIATSDTGETLSALREAKMLVCNSGGWDESYIEILDPGDWIQITSAGYDSYPIDIFRERGIALTNATGNYGPVVAEHTFALALSFSRMLPHFLRNQEQRKWGSRTEISLKLGDWKDHTLTIYGLGNIGESIAERGLAFDMDVYGIKRSPDDYDGCLAADQVLSESDFHDILPETDLLVAIVPLTEETRNSINRKVFQLLPDSAIFINVARGAVVEEKALINALRHGKIAGAGLDVFREEPLCQDSPLWERDDVILTPHIAGRSSTFPERFTSLFLENYDRWQENKALVNQVV